MTISRPRKAKRWRRRMRLLTGDVAAVIIEPLIQGAGGMRMCRAEFLRALTGRVKGPGALWCSTK